MIKVTICHYTKSIGSQPQCPQCGYGSAEQESLPIYPPGSIEPNICVTCPRCKYEVKVDVGEGTCEFAHLVDFISFFQPIVAWSASVHGSPLCSDTTEKEAREIAENAFADIALPKMLVEWNGDTRTETTLKTVR